MMRAAADKLCSYPWPGNVRELQNCVERAVALSRFDKIGVDDLPEKIRDFAAKRIVVDTGDPTHLLPLADVEEQYVLRVLDAVGGNKTLAADVLKIDRRTLYRKLERWSGVPPSSSESAPESKEMDDRDSAGTADRNAGR
jgi:two-component system response regulator HydG